MLNSTENIIKQSGITFFEVIIVLAIIAVLMLLAIPVSSKFISTSHLKSASEVIKSFIETGQNHAYLNNKDLFISFSEDTPLWCFGMDDQSPCDCLVSNDCQVNEVEYVIHSSNTNKNITVGIDQYTHQDGRTLQVSGLRQLIVQGGQINILSQGHQLNLIVDTFGVNTCSTTNEIGYKSC